MEMPDKKQGKAESAIPMTQLDMFKGVTKDLAVNALKAATDMAAAYRACPQSLGEAAEQYYLLRHYLDYLIRFCDGKV
jgi:hypothetical protein